MVNDPSAGEFVDGLPRARPQDVGVSPCAIGRFLTDAAQSGVELNSLMVWRGGAVAAEGWWRPYRPELRHMMHSATKSFLSAGVGLAIGENHFALDDRVIDFFPRHRPEAATANLASMTVEDLLTQTSGHAHGTSGVLWRNLQTSWVSEFFKIDAPHTPGAHFQYTSATSFMLSAIISQTTGETAHDYMRPRLFEPLGVRDLTWDVGPENINPGGNGISCLTSDLLKLAVLHLQGGVWNGERLLNAVWVRAATTAKRGNPHGYHWWIGPDDAFYAYGVFGQFALVFPRHGAVVVLTSATPPGEDVLRALMWRHFPAAFEEPAAGQGRDLEERLGALDLLEPLAATRAPSPAIAGGRWTAEPNGDGVEGFEIELDDRLCRFRLKDARGVHEIDCGVSEWVEGWTTMSGAPLHHGYEPERLRVVAAARWRAPDTLEMTWRFNETSFCDTATITFGSDGQAAYDRRVNVNTRLLTRPTVHAHAFREGDAPFRPSAAGVASRFSTRRSTIGELMDDPAARAVLVRHLPRVLSSPLIERGRPYILEDAAPYAPELTAGVLAAIDTDLAALDEADPQA